MSVVFQRTNQANKKFPSCREFQILAFVKYTKLYANDLNETYRAFGKLLIVRYGWHSPAWGFQAFAPMVLISHICSMHLVCAVARQDSEIRHQCLKFGVSCLKRNLLLK